MSKLICNGWEVFFHSQLFGLQYQQLIDRVTLLKQRLPESEFKTHTTVKLFAAITVGIESKIPADPFASHFALTTSLKRYGRMKKMGLPERYRLFFRAFDVPERPSIVILWLGFPRKEGAKDDCYQVFSKMVTRGDFPDSMEQLLAECALLENEI
jgi:toxin YhaV